MTERSTISELLRLTFAGPDGCRRLSFNDAPGAASYVSHELFEAYLDELDAIAASDTVMTSLQALGAQLLLSTAGLSSSEALHEATLSLAAEKAAAARLSKGPACH